MVGDGGALGAGLCRGAATAIDRQTTECVGGTASTMGLPSHEAEYATKTTREHEDGNRPLSRYHLPKEHYLGLLYTPKATINRSPQGTRASRLRIARVRRRPRLLLSVMSRPYRGRLLWMPAQNRIVSQKRRYNSPYLLFSAHLFGEMEYFLYLCTRIIIKLANLQIFKLLKYETSLFALPARGNETSVG